MRYPRKLFFLQYAFAEKVSKLVDQDLFESLKKYTPYFYLIGNHTWDIEKPSHHWNEFEVRVTQGTAPNEIAYKMYIKNLKEDSAESEFIGCFNFKYLPEKKTVKIHFINVDKSGFGPLSKERVNVRKDELKKLFTKIKRQHPEAEFVEGGSWLYNLDSYKRLFPASYTKDIERSSVKPLYTVIWGQFINSEGEVKTEMLERFLHKLNQAKSMDEAFESFDYKDLFPRGLIGDFYEEYGVSE